MAALPSTGHARVYPRISLDVLDDLTYLPRGFHTPGLRLIMELQQLDEATLERLLRAVFDKAIRRAIDESTLRELARMYRDGELDLETILAWAEDKSAGDFRFRELCREQARAARKMMSP